MKFWNNAYMLKKTAMCLLALILFVHNGSAYSHNTFKVPNDLNKRIEHLPLYSSFNEAYGDYLEEIIDWTGHEMSVGELGLFVYDMLEDVYDKGRDGWLFRYFSAQDRQEKIILDHTIVALAGLVMGEKLRPSKLKEFVFFPPNMVSSCFENPSQSFLELEDSIKIMRGSLILPRYCPCKFSRNFFRKSLGEIKVD